MNSGKSWRSVEQRREGEVREVDNMTREGERKRQDESPCRILEILGGCSTRGPFRGHATIIIEFDTKRIRNKTKREKGL